MGSTKKILVAPLNWGLGHATRCIPIIRALIDQGHEVIIASSAGPRKLLEQEFPELTSIELSGYHVEYGTQKSFMSRFVKQLPEMLVHVQKEYNLLKEVIQTYNIDVVISDNRYGLRNEQVKSILITHQLNLHLPWGNTAANWVNHKLLKQFNEIWIPDYAGKHALAGKLSQNLGEAIQNVRYIGPLSRFDKPSEDAVMDLDFVAVISGPEPQRTILNKIILNQLEHTDFSGVIVQGLPEQERFFKLRDGITVHSHLPSNELKRLMDRAKVIISRSGYTTIMELLKMGKPGILIPTPGQPEQEYLAEHLKKHEQFIFVKQKHVNFTKLLTRSFPAIQKDHAKNPLLIEAIEGL